MFAKRGNLRFCENDVHSVPEWNEALGVHLLQTEGSKWTLRTPTRNVATKMDKLTIAKRGRRSGIRHWSMKERKQTERFLFAILLLLLYLLSLVVVIILSTHSYTRVNIDIYWCCQLEEAILVRTQCGKKEFYSHLKIILWKQFLSLAFHKYKLISRNFYLKIVRVNSCNFHTVALQCFSPCLEFSLRLHSKPHECRIFRQVSPLFPCYFIRRTPTALPDMEVLRFQARRYLSVGGVTYSGSLETEPIFAFFNCLSHIHDFFIDKYVAAICLYFSIRLTTIHSKIGSI